MEVAGYTKLFSSILMSSIWEESTETRLVWVTLLALADQNGHVDGTVKSLARVSRVSLEECQTALDCLLGPDPLDRSGVEGGRRIVPEQGGWRLVNHAAYRAKMSADERRERDKIRKREARTSTVSAGRPQTSEFVRDVSQAEAEAKADSKAKAKTEQTKREERGGGVIVSPVDFEKLKRFNAYIGTRLRVPHKLHHDFVAALGGESPDTTLRAWYAAVDAEIEVSREPIVPDVWKWLEARFKAWASEQVEAATWAQMEREARELDAADEARKGARRG